jgi:predicted N-acetyltransferase YhbS
MPEIRTMQKSDIGAVVEVMARAFQNAALYSYFEPRAEKRPEFLRMIFSHRIPFSIASQNGSDGRDADVALVDGKIAGAALWGKPGAASAENPALTEAVKNYDSAVFEKWTGFHDTLFSALSGACPEPHWSLAPVAVVPEAQGAGVGSALIRGKLAEIDASGFPCLLGTQDEVNTKIYARYGFAVALETQVAPGVRCWAMLRKPADGFA